MKYCGQEILRAALLLRGPNGLCHNLKQVARNIANWYRKHCNQVGGENFFFVHHVKCGRRESKKRVKIYFDLQHKAGKKMTKLNGSEDLFLAFTQNQDNKLANPVIIILFLSLFCPRVCKPQNFSQPPWHR